MLGRLKALWDKIAGWLFGSAGGAIVRDAATEFVKVVGAAAASALLAQATTKAGEIEDRYGAGRGPAKAQELGAYISQVGVQLGLTLATRLVNYVIETAVLAMTSSRRPTT